jgi:hypothetical protein
MSVQIVTAVVEDDGNKCRIRATVTAPERWCNGYTLEVPVETTISRRQVHIHTAQRFADLLGLTGVWLLRSNEDDDGWTFVCVTDAVVAFTVPKGVT